MRPAPEATGLVQARVTQYNYKSSWRPTSTPRAKFRLVVETAPSLMAHAVGITSGALRATM